MANGSGDLFEMRVLVCGMQPVGPARAAKSGEDRGAALYQSCANASCYLLKPMSAHNQIELALLYDAKFVT
jgi:hypothetical protein